LHSTKWSDGKKKKGWKPLSSENNSTQDSEGNEETGHSDLDPNKIMINDTKEPSDAHKKHPQKKSCGKSLRISWRRY
jgi:hypothetical protein